MSNYPDQMGFRQKNVGVYLFLLLITIALTGYELTIMDFKFDAPRGIKLGDQTRDAGFMVTKGKHSLATSIHFPPYFAYYMGVLTAISRNPLILSIITAIFATFGLGIAMYYYRSNLPQDYAIYAAALLAVNPAFIIMSHILWEVSPQLFFAPFLLIFIHQFFLHKNRSSFILATVVVTFLSQFYLTGFFFYPLLALLGLIYWRDLGWIGLFISVFIAIILSGPFIYFLLFQGGLAHAISSASKAVLPESVSGWDLFLTQARISLINNVSMASIQHLLQFFDNFDEALLAAAGSFGKPLYWASASVSASFVIGWLTYIGFIFSRRRLFSAEPADTRRFPLPFQVAGFLVTGFVGLYIFMRTPSWYQHSLVLYPCYPLLAAWPFWRLFSIRPVKYLAGLTVVATASLLFILMVFSKSSYGWFNQSFSYYGLSKLNKEIWEKTPEGDKPQIFVGPGGVYMQAIQMSYAVGHESAGNSLYPVTVRVMKVKAPGLDRYKWRVDSINDIMVRRRAALTKMERLIPDRSPVSADDTWNERGFWNQINDPFPSFDTPYGRLAGRNNVYRFPVGAGSAEYIALDVGDPRLLDYTLLEKVDGVARRYLFDRSYGLVFAKEGVLLFQKGASMELNHRAYLEGLNKFYGSKSLRQTGDNESDYLSRTGAVRVAVHGKTDPGAMSIGPYISLPNGSYVARFKVKTGDNKAGEVFMIDVASDKGKKIHASRKLSGEDFSKSGKWQNFALSFKVTDDIVTDVEFRAFYLGGATVYFKSVALEPDREAFFAMVKEGGVK